MCAICFFYWFCLVLVSVLTSFLQLSVLLRTEEEYLSGGVSMVVG